MRRRVPDKDRSRSQYYADSSAYTSRHSSSSFAASLVSACSSYYLLLFSRLLPDRKPPMAAPIIFRSIPSFLPMGISAFCLMCHASAFACFLIRIFLLHVFRKIPAAITHRAVAVLVFMRIDIMDLSFYYESLVIHSPFSLFNSFRPCREVCSSACPSRSPLPAAHTV